MKSASAIITRMLASGRIGYIITLFVTICATSSGDVVLSNGNYTWLAAVFSPFFFVLYDYEKLLYLGASKKDYFTSAMAAYGILAIVISALNTGIHLLIDPLYSGRTVINHMDVCLWMDNGPFAALIQQACFLLLVMIFLHVLLSMQRYWYGWLADVLIVAVIAVFTPIAPLRSLLSSFFHLIMINGSAVIQISACLGLSVLLSLAGILVLKRRTM